MKPRIFLMLVSICLLNLAACFAATPAPTEMPTIAATPIAPPTLTLLLRLGNGVIYDTVLSPDGKLFAISSSTGIYIYNVKDMSLVRFISLNEAEMDRVVFSQEGHFLVGSGYYQEHPGVMLWDLDSGKLLHTVGGMPYQPRGLAFSLNEQTVAIGGDDGMVQLRDVVSGEPLATFNVDLSILALAYSPDGTKLIIGGNGISNTLQIWDVKTYKNLFTLDASGSVSDLKFNRDGSKLAVAGLRGIRCDLLQVWSVDNGRLLKDFGDCVEPTFQLGYSRDDKTIATRIDADTLLIYDIASGQQSDWTHLDENTSREYDIGIEPDWGSYYRSFTGQIRSVSFSPDNSKLVVGYWNNGIAIWDVKSGKLLLPIEAVSPSIDSVALNPNGSLLVSGDEDGNVQLWNIESGQLLDNFENSPPVASIIMSSTHGVAFTPDGKFLAAAREYIVCGPNPPAPNSCNGITGWTGVYIWDVASGRVIHSFDAGKHPITRIAFNPQGDILAAGVGNGAEVMLWNVQSGKPLSYTIDTPGYAVISLAFDPTGKILATAGDGGKIGLWNVSNGQLLNVLQGHNDWVAGLAFLKDGRAIISSAKDGLKVWDTGSGRLLTMSNESIKDITTMDVSANDQLIAAGSNDGTVQLWRITWP